MHAELNRSGVGLTNADIGKNIQRLRRRHGVTAADLCRAINKSEQWLRDRENGIEILTLANLIDIADALKEPGRVFFDPPVEDSVYPAFSNGFSNILVC